MMKAIWLDGVNGMRLRADVAGDSSRPTVLLLHGGGQTRHAWRSAMNKLVDHGCHVVSLDMRGHGESAWADDGNYSIDAFVRDLRAVLEQLPPRPVIVGASLGGVTALSMIGEAEVPIASALVLVDVTPRIRFEGVARIVAFMTANPEGFGSLEEVADAIATYLPHRPRRSDPANLERNLRRNAAGRYVWHWDPRFLNFGDVSLQSLQQRYEAAARRITVPTLLVRGLQSDIVDAETADEFCALIPHALVTSVKGAAHMVAGDRNDEFITAIVEFLDGILPSGARETAAGRHAS